MRKTKLTTYQCAPQCRCPNCDPVMSQVMSMSTDQYSEYLQAVTAAMISTAPTGPGIVPAQLRHMADYRTEFRTATPPTQSTPAPTRAATPPDVVRAMVEAKRAEMAAEREGRKVRRRARNEIARDYAYAVKNPPPEPYTEALARRGTVPAVWYSDGGCPEPYSLALGEIVPRRADGTPVRLPQGDAAPLPHTLALEASRQPNRNGN